MLLLITGQGDTDEKADLDHDQNLRNLLDLCRARNIQLKKEEFRLKCSEVSIIRHVITRNGLKADPKKVKAIIKMEQPADVPAVQRFIGLVKYLSKFLQDQSELCEPLRRLTHRKAEWNWTHEQEDAFEKIKDAVSKAPVLKYCSESDLTEGEVDASNDGLGVVLMQLGQPVKFASRALTLSERKYSQIRKELLVQVFGMEDNHHHVYVRMVIFWKDHKPLVSISQKLLASLFKRLKHLLL